MQQPNVKEFFHEDSSTWSYVVSDPETGRAAVIDAVLDFDSKSGRTGTGSVEEIIDYVREHDLKVDWVLETHAHADHLAAAPRVREALGGTIAIGEGIRQVQERFRKIFNFEKEFLPDGAQFDHLFQDGDSFNVGNIEGRVMHTPGHTSDSMSYIIGDAVFVGDTLFMPDAGTARCDFPGGDAAVMYRSIQKLFELPDETRMFMCHDYQPGGRAPLFETTVAEQKRDNIHVGGGKSEAEFVKQRNERDASLAMPRLIVPSIQVNIRAGEFPPPEDNGTVYLKVPVDTLGKPDDKPLTG